jgi:hypothetical protein
MIPAGEAMRGEFVPRIWAFLTMAKSTIKDLKEIAKVISSEG